MAEKKSCFIIMPITTPKTHFKVYRDGMDHFKHVLEYLIIPAVEKAEMKPIPPKAKGSDLIQAEIIKNLETSDLVLCDMSTLNPNVFFEFGIRTSLNKPVCVIKDEQTKKVPFDTSILNYQEYKSTLETWEISTEIDRLAEHINESITRSKNKNTLWKYFGLRTEAKPFESTSKDDSHFDLIQFKLDSISNQLGMIHESKKEHLSETDELLHELRIDLEEIDTIETSVKELMRAFSHEIVLYSVTADPVKKNIFLFPQKKIPETLKKSLEIYCKNFFGYTLKIGPIK